MVPPRRAPGRSTSTLTSSPLAIALGAAVVYGTMCSAADAGAQARKVERRGLGAPGGRLIAFYSSVLAFSPAAPVQVRGEPAVALALELSYVPRLSASQRRADFDKPEATNLVPVYPRPRLYVRAPGDVRLEASWLPPVPVFDVRASLFSLAAAREIVHIGRLGLAGRAGASWGRVRAAITCYEALGRGTQAEQIYFAAVCHARESDDHFEPRQLSGEVTANWPAFARGIVPYGGVGALGDRTRFDVGVRRADGSRDTDEPILELRAVRAYAFAGAGWRVGRATEMSGEAYYGVGTLVTVRVMARVRLR